jgi:hypothetical protein
MNTACWAAGMNADGSNRGYGDSGPCNVNTVCPEGDLWRDEIRSVAHVILGGGVCTGTLLNNCANDSTPYFLTANHCTEGNETNASWVFVFNWESPVCDPTENAPMDHSITGCDKLLENSPTDAAFLLLSSIPPMDYIPYYSGWDKSGTPPDSVHCIHHPSGDIKKISSSHAAPFDQQNLTWATAQRIAGTFRNGTVAPPNRAVLAAACGTRTTASSVSYMAVKLPAQTTSTTISAAST